jgi:hypothetical protein
MMDFEDQLRAALARKEPPTGFAERAMARAAKRKVPGHGRRPFWKPWVAGCVAASLLAGAFGIKEMEARRERDKGQAARAHLLQALEITRAKLHHIQQQIESVN